MPRMGNAYILDAARSPRGRGKAGKGALSGVHPQELLAQVLKASVARAKIDASALDDVVIGVVSQAGEQGANLARNAVLAADLPEKVSGTTINRFCGSGLQAVAFAASGVASGFQDLVLAGGVESMSRVPLGADGGGIDGNNLLLRAKHFQVPQGISADLIATRQGYSRADLDAWALRSQQRAAIASSEGRFAKSLVPIVDETGALLLDKDEYPRPDTTAAALAELKPAFEKLGAMQIEPDATIDQIALRKYPDVKTIEHVHTAGNSSGIVDGSAAVVLASEAYVQQHGAKPRARIRSIATLATEPVIMLTAPAPTSQLALQKAGMQVSDIDLWEINEAFAAVVLETIGTLGLDPDKVNVNGGAIALGHPLGATGAVLLGTALDELERRDLTTALITLCIGGGQGIAVVIERLK